VEVDELGRMVAVAQPDVGRPRRRVEDVRRHRADHAGRPAAPCRDADLRSWPPGRRDDTQRGVTRVEYRLGHDWARACDRAGAGACARERFHLPPGRIYLDGNSLGLPPRGAEAAVRRALAEWRRLAIDGWLGAERPWFRLGEELGVLQAPLVGAEPDEVVATGGTTVNLHALVATFYRPSGRRRKILADELNFPSDLYALRGQIALRGGDGERDLVLVPSRDGRTIEEGDVVAAMTDEVALVLLPSVLYRSGQLLDVAGLTRAAAARGIPIGLDCSHSVGALPHRLHAWGVDFAFWCGYKYLNGGPGAIASLFVHRRHFGRAPALAGWWGSDKARQFDMALRLAPAATAGAWQIGTPPLLSAVALRPALAIFREIGIEAVRARSLELTGYLVFLIDRLLAPLGFALGTPREPARRGGHVALEHPEAVRIARALKARRLVPDFRPPNALRLAPVALYNTFEELWRTAEALREIVEAREYDRYPAEREVVA
jgi:kynureninase